jgi:hypothetical protein
MARSEENREDLLREATALVERVELRVDGFTESIVLGFRSKGACSIFFGADPVYQFNVRRELRRAYRAGKLLKAERGRLVELTRKRTADATQLVRRDFSDAETAAIAGDVQAQLVKLRDALAANRYEIVGQVPENVDVVGRCRDELAMWRREFRIADSPRVDE